jgi:integrase
MPKLTKKLVEAIEPESKDVIIRDSELKGFICKVTPKGKRVYMLYYRTKEGRERKPLIGVHGVLSCEGAREIALEWLAQVSKGEDPSLMKQEARKTISIKELSERYMDEYATAHKKSSSIRMDKGNLALHINPVIGAIRITTITRQDIGELHHSLKDTPITANRCLALISKMLNLAEQWGLRQDGSNPCRHIQKYPENKRERFLSIEEIQNLSAILNKAEQEGNEMQSVVNAIRLLILTGCRLNEVLTLKWEYIDQQNHCLRLPDSKTGAKTVYLAPAALDIIANISRVEGNPYVIIGKNKGACLVNLQKPWTRIRIEAKLPEVRLHDLRHSFASIGAASGLSLPIIGALLGHTQTQTTARYAHLIGAPLKDAASMIGSKIDAAMKRQGTGK